MDLSNDMTWRQMIGVGVRRVILARGELDNLEGPGYGPRGGQSYAERREQGIGRQRRARLTYGLHALHTWNATGLTWHYQRRVLASST